MTFGRGDAILRYPELIEGYDFPLAEWIRGKGRRYVAVHIHASSPHKVPPHPEILTGGLLRAGIPFVMLGSESFDLPPNFRLHADVARRAAKFIGTLSVFNVVAQVSKIPSFVLVNRSIKEPHIYALMEANRAQVVSWNVGDPIESIYADAVRWAGI
jgi:hypothetical protein